MDSGTLVIVDPAYVAADDDEDRPAMTYEQLIGRLEDYPEPAQLSAGLGEAFVRLSGFGGDGSYSVFVGRNAGGEIKAAMILLGAS